MSTASFVRCTTPSSLRSVLRWGTFGAGIIYGRFRFGHFWKVKESLMIQKKQAWEAENKELRDQIKTLEADLLKMKNTESNDDTQETNTAVASEELETVVSGNQFENANVLPTE